jgi:hypothetical protein
MPDEAARFSTNSNVTLDVNGYGAIRLAPAGQKWQITSTNVLCSTRVAEARCRVYIGQVSDSNVIDGTYSGSSGDTSDTVYYLNDGEAMWVEWSGGDPGAIATVKINGWTSVPNRGFRAVH